MTTNLYYPWVNSLQYHSSPGFLVHPGKVFAPGAAAPGVANQESSFPSGSLARKNVPARYNSLQTKIQQCYICGY